MCKCVGGNNFPFFLSRECLKFNWGKINVLIRRHNGPSQLFVAEFRSPPHGLLYLPPLQILTWTSCLPNIKWAVRCFITFLMWLSLVWLLSVPRYAVLTQVIFCCGLLMLQQQIEWCALNSNEEKELVYLGFFEYRVSILKRFVTQIFLYFRFKTLEITLFKVLLGNNSMSLESKVI